VQSAELAHADHGGGSARLGLQLSAFLLAFDASANGYIIQYWQERLGFGARLSSWFLGAYILGELAGAPLGGYLAARWGSARAFRRSALLFALGALLAGSNLSLPVALLGRILQGLAAGPLLPLAAVLISSVSRRRPSARAASCRFFRSCTASRSSSA
jgi:MFS transporter, DHA2 family, multidrug resistance protein